MSFIATLQSLRGGVLDRLDDELLEVADQVDQTGKSGTVTLKLTLKKNGESAITVLPEVSAKVPHAALGDSLFFVQGGRLTRRNPHQMDIEDELQAKRDERDLG